MSGRMRDSERYVENPDGSYSRAVGGQTVGATAVVEGYDAMTKAELEDELESRGLPKTGNKDELVARLQEADAA